MKTQNNFADLKDRIQKEINEAKRLTTMDIVRALDWGYQEGWYIAEKKMRYLNDLLEMHYTKGQMIEAINNLIIDSVKGAKESSCASSNRAEVLNMKALSRLKEQISRY